MRAIILMSSSLELFSATTHNFFKMSLQHSLEFKLLFDCLAGSNGRVMLDILANGWPDDDKLPPNLAKDCIAYWKSATSHDGSLTWRGFSSGLYEAFKADSTRLSQIKPATSPVEPHVTEMTTTSTKELERMLAKCPAEKIAKALTRSRKEVYSYQKSVNAITSPRKGSCSKVDPHRRSSSFADTHSQSKTFTYEDKEKVVLQQVEQLLRDKLKHKSQGDDAPGVIDEVLQQLHNILRISNPGGGSHEQFYSSTNPYATIRRGSKQLKGGPSRPTSVLLPDKRDHSLGSPRHADYPPMHSRQIKIDRSTSLPTRHIIFDHAPIMDSSNEPPPPYSATQYPLSTNRIIGQTHSKRSSQSMTNLTVQGPTTDARQILETWKYTKIAGQPSSTATSVPHHQSIPHTRGSVDLPVHPLTDKGRQPPSKQYFSSPDLSQEQTLSPTELKTAEMYGTIRHGTKQNKSIIQEQFLQIQQLQNEKDALIKHIFQHQAHQEYSVADDSILSVL